MDSEWMGMTILAPGMVTCLANWEIKNLGGQVRIFTDLHWSSTFTPFAN